ncbi:hypothetical protein J7E91_33445 [Streptomyces sp. ISL-99]|uniref:hypothetical protein n=1 Tax=Streptomyces sp. ISL-99 TaxID=2819193 RepID=UPI001BEB0B8F|nr:hypothetical protein [Streptomyces sp. ISL-99]MBT2530132.1 hypothetical protein [Streptomyces sp. ISL-99]
MPDATEIAVISSVLPATLTFIYQRAERLLSRRGSEPETELSLPDSLVGDLQLPLQPDTDQLLTRRGELEQLRDALAVYAQGDAPVRPRDQALLRNLNRLRRALEEIYCQRLTFEGEDRPASGPFVQQRLKEVSGEVTGMDADEIDGTARLVQDVDRVAHGGKVTGMKARRIGR